MSRRPFVPNELRSGPFTVDEALRAGLSRRQLQGSSWRRVAHGRYIWAGLADDPRHLLRAMHRGLPMAAAFSDHTAGWLHGLDLPPCQPIHVTIPTLAGTSHRAGVQFHRRPLAAVDVGERGGLPVTSPLRTAFDLARHLRPDEAVVAVDMALYAALVTLDDLRVYVAEHRAFRGVVQAREVVALAEPRSESPMETRLRLLLVNAGLPRPQVQAELRDERGAFVARVDLYYPDQRLAIEYDGGAHRDSLVADNRRQNRLLAAGYRLLRFTSADVNTRSDAVVAAVAAQFAYVR